MVTLLAEASVSAMLGTSSRSDASVERSSWDESRVAKSDWAVTPAAKAVRIATGCIFKVGESSVKWNGSRV